MSCFFPFYDVPDQSPNQYSSSPYHRYSSDPLGLTHLQDPYGDTFYRSPSISRNRGRDPHENRHARYNRPYRGPASPSYEDSMRAESARRLAEARMRQLAQSKSNEQTKVEVTLPDGRQCVVPLSWARKMQSKYPNILTQSMIQPHHPPSPPPISLDQQSASDSDHDSNFYVLDPTQDPSVPSATASSSIPIHRSPSPQPPRHSPEEFDAAARLIQQQFRTYQSLKRLDQIESTFHLLKSEFSYPSPLDVTFIESPQQSTSSSPSKLAFNNPVNRPVQAFEEGLTRLQIEADAILSRGNAKIKHWRKRLIKEIESQLDQLDRFKSEAWNSLKLAHEKSSSQRPDLKTGDMSATSQPQNHTAKSDSEDVEMDVDIKTNEANSASDRFNHGESALAIAPSELEVLQPGTLSEDDLVIPMTEPLAKSLEHLVIPTSSSPQSNPVNVSPCIVNPLVTQEGDLICPTPFPRGSDDIIVSPI